MKAIIRIALIAVGGFLLMYNILQFDSEVEAYASSRTGEKQHIQKYYYHQENQIGASLGLALFLSGIFVKDTARKVKNIL